MGSHGGISHGEIELQGLTHQASAFREVSEQDTGHDPSQACISRQCFYPTCTLGVTLGELWAGSRSTQAALRLVVTPE